MDKNSVVFLEGKKTILRPFNKATDLADVIRWINDPEVRQYLSSYLPKTERQEEEWFANHGKDQEDIIFAIVDKETGRLIGSMGIHAINWKDRIATTGALLGEKKYWGKGYGTDAKMILLNYAFNDLNLHKICSSVIAYNQRSLRYSLHCGYKIEGTRKQHMFRKGKYWDLIELGLFKKDWLPIWRRYLKTGYVH